jgi:lipopolysaccharide transport protein LptA
MNNLIKFFLIVCLCLPAMLVAAEKKEKEAQRDSKVTISADRFEWAIGNVLKLDGNVLVEDAAMTLNSEHMLVFFTKKDDKDGAAEETSMNVEKIEASGRVMVRTADDTRSATGDRGLYDAAKDIITLDGDCTIMANGSVMRSNRVIFDRKRQTVSAARAVITIPTGNNRGDSALDGIFSGGKSGDDKKSEKKAPAEGTAAPAGSQQK